MKKTEATQENFNMKTKKIIDWVSIYLLILSGFTLAVETIFNFDILKFLTSLIHVGEYINVLYVIIGLSAVWLSGRTKPFTPFGKMEIN